MIAIIGPTPVTSILLPVIQEMIIPTGNIATMIGLTPVTSILLQVNQKMATLIVPANLIRNIAPIPMALIPLPAINIFTDANSVMFGLFANHTSGYLPAFQFPPQIKAGPEVLFYVLGCRYFHSAYKYLANYQPNYLKGT
jgi:hypothetical protein